MRGVDNWDKIGGTLSQRKKVNEKKVAMPFKQSRRLPRIPRLSAIFTDFALPLNLQQVPDPSYQRTSLVVILAVQDAQDRHEQVQDIQV